MRLEIFDTRWAFTGSETTVLIGCRVGLKTIATPT